MFFIRNSNKTEDIIKDLSNLENLFDISNLTNSKLFIKKNIKKVVGRFNIETPHHIWIDSFICLCSKAHSYRCGHSNTNKLKE